MLMGRALRQRQSAADQGPLSRLREARGSHAHGNDSPLLPRPSTGSKPVLGRGRVRKPGAQTHSQGLELAQAHPTWDIPRHRKASGTPCPAVSTQLPIQLSSPAGRAHYDTITGWEF